MAEPPPAGNDALARVAARDEQRRQKIQETKAQKEAEGAFDLKKFQTEFDNQLAEVKAQIAAAAAVDSIMPSYRELQTYVNEHTALASQTEIGRCKKALESALADIQALSGQGKKKKFAFKSKPVSRPAAPVADTPKEPEVEVPWVENQTVVLTDTSQINIVKHRNCVVHVKNAISSLHLSHFYDCVVIAKIHQARLHDSERCKFLLDCGSLPMIERCKDVSFAPHPQNPDFGSDTWKVEVQDFQWLKDETTPSPHWRILPVAERKSTMQDVQLE
eukprot:NODE_2908_length_972_cov_111.337278_g2888_i0.p1 GENE.NODE_2908_length_972_cov_111.337278_g2888_i0~~NODE_2908_length_972_cov_111.337278_g2888_i0.p1  ORF type:complete len:275 (+),score=59.96 NODE_2908_length_972_cov_111.337278_g2888_i0:76-900(+)